jgi:azurin
VNLMRHGFLTTIVLGAAAVSFHVAPLAAQAAPKVCKLTIAGNDAMQFDQKELKAAGDCTEIELTLKHTGKLPAQSMGHNWVLVKTPDMNAVSSAGMAAGLANQYVPPKDKRVIASTKIIGGGESTTIKIPTSTLKKGEAYSYLCSFPGHSALMKGKFTFG